MHKAIVITGAGKGLGKKLAEVFKAEGWTVIAPSREELDLSRQNSIDTLCGSLR
jgi:3-oxoacyl-[acyl-carrier protein] reductase